MIKINRELQVACDIDNTLLIHGTEVNDYYSKDVTFVTDPYDNTSKYFHIHLPHIKLLKDYKARGYYIVLWSANGGDWAEAVAKAIFGADVDKYVDECRTKFIKHVDDLPSDKILGERVWIDYVK